MSAAGREPLFLDVEDLLSLHALLVERFDLPRSVRQRERLEAIVAQVELSFGGEFARRAPFEMAAAYLFRIATDKPFVAANEAVGLLAALTFLQANRVPLNGHDESLEELVRNVADGVLDELALAAELESWVGAERAM